MNSEYDFTVEINKCFSNYFPITQERFNTQIDLFLFFATIENSCKAQLNLICSSEENKHSIKDKKMAKYILYEKEMISFEKIKQSEKIIKIITQCYEKVAPLVDSSDIEGVIGMICDREEEEKVKKEIKRIIRQIENLFEVSIIESFRNKNDNRTFTVPKFLIRKYKKLLKSRMKRRIRTDTINFEKYELTPEQKEMDVLYENMIIDKQISFINNSMDILKLIMIQNRNYFKNDPFGFEYFVANFQSIIESLNLIDEIDANKENNSLYNINKYISKLKKEYIDSKEEEIEEQRQNIILEFNLYNKQKKLQLLFSLTLILAKLIEKKGIFYQIRESIKPYSRMKTILYNTMKIYDKEIETVELSNYIQSSVIFKKIFPTFQNMDYNLQIIKAVLEHSPSNSIRQLSNNFFNKQIKEFPKPLFDVLSSITLSPSNKKVKSSSVVILISGFLSEEENHDSEWENLTFSLDNSNSLYFYNWPGESIKKALGTSLLRVANVIPNLQSGLSALNTLVSNPVEIFRNASRKAGLSGKLLGTLLASKQFFPFQSITLIGFSLGVHVIKNCIKQMYKINKYTDVDCRDVIENVILIAGATSMYKKEEKYKDIFNTIVSRNIIQCYSNADEVLNVLYRTAMNKEPVGISELKLAGLDKIKNCDFSSMEIGHLDYRKKMDLVMNKISIL